MLGVGRLWALDRVEVLGRQATLRAMPACPCFDLSCVKPGVQCVRVSDGQAAKNTAAAKLSPRTCNNSELQAAR